MEIAAITAFLAPFLSALLKPVTAAAADAAGRFGEAAVEQAKVLWGHLRGKVETKPIAKAAAEEIAANPDDAAARAALQGQLEKIVEDDPAFAEELARLWQNAKQQAGIQVTVTASGAGSIAIGGDAVNSSFTTNTTKT
jgi:hypothetical protein